MAEVNTKERNRESSSHSAELWMGPDLTSARPGRSVVGRTSEMNAPWQLSARGRWSVKLAISSPQKVQENTATLALITRPKHMQPRSSCRYRGRLNIDRLSPLNGSIAQICSMNHEESQIQSFSPGCSCVASSALWSDQTLRLQSSSAMCAFLIEVSEARSDEDVFGAEHNLFQGHCEDHDVKKNDK